MKSENSPSPNPAVRFAAEPLLDENRKTVKAIRFSYLDGIRGLAALYVAAFHCYQMQLFVSPGIELARTRYFQIFKPLCMGHYAVAVFIVLSGYCLMLPIASRGGDYLMRNGYKEYFFRRARRIIPPFYAAVLLTICVLPITNSIWHRVLNAGNHNVHSLVGNFDGPRFVLQLLSHLCLINNGVPFNDETVVKFASNTPLWSVATESQIYILFPALLLPALRRYGPLILLLTGVGVGALLSFAFDGGYQLACPWMFGIFTIGVLGALISCSPGEMYGKLRERIPWGLVALLIIAMFLIIGMINLGLYRRHPVIVDTCLGFGIMSFLVAMSLKTEASQRGVVKVFANIFSSRLCRWLGDLSYSLYLVHYPMLVLLQGIALYIFASLPLIDYILLFPGMAVVIGVAYAFSGLFESRFRAANANSVV